MQKEETKIRKTFRLSLQAQRPEMQIPFSLPCQKRMGGGRQGGWGVRLVEKSAFHFEGIVGISHRSAHLSDEAEKKCRNSFFVDSVQFR